jgi:chromosome segregation ATPase
MPTTAVHDPAAIEAEIEEIEARRDRLREEAETVEGDLEAAREKLQTADGDDARSGALSEARDLQIEYDTLTEAIDELTREIESLRERLEEARAARREERELTELAEQGREAVEAGKRVEELERKLLSVLREIGADLLDAREEWAEKAEGFRTRVIRKEKSVQYRRSESDGDVERAEALISELVERGVEDFALATAEPLSPDHIRYRGPSDRDGHLRDEARLLQRIRTFLQSDLSQ